MPFADGGLSGHMAQGRMEAAKLLMEKGADVSSRNEDMKTAGVSCSLKMIPIFYFKRMRFWYSCSVVLTRDEMNHDIV